MGHACAVRFGCYKVSKRGCCLSQKGANKNSCDRKLWVILTYDQLNLNALNFGFEWVKKNIKRIKNVRPKKNKKNGWSTLVKISINYLNMSNFIGPLVPHVECLTHICRPSPDDMAPILLPWLKGKSHPLWRTS